MYLHPRAPNDMNLERERERAFGVDVNEGYFILIIAALFLCQHRTPGATWRQPQPNSQGWEPLKLFNKYQSV
jgi:hypothetical protein